MYKKDCPPVDDLYVTDSLLLELSEKSLYLCSCRSSLPQHSAIPQKLVVSLYQAVHSVIVIKVVAIPVY